MIVFIKSDGTVASVVSSPFYQGSSLSGAFHLVAPYPRNYSASVRFILADGRYTEYYPMTPVSELPNALSGLAENVTVYEIASKTGEITAKSGTVTAQFTIAYNGEVQTTASVNFTVNVGVPSLPNEQTQPTDDEWLRLLEVITQLSNKLPANGAMDFTVDIVTINGAVYYRYIKTYANGTTAEIDVPVITDDGAVMQSGMTKVDIPLSAWEGSSAPYTFTIESGIPDGMFVAELMEKTTNGYATRADSIDYNANGSISIKSNSKYQGMLVFTNNAIFNNAVKKTGDTMTGMLTVEGNFGEAFKARRSAILSGTTKRKRLYSGIKVDGNDLLGHIQCADETGSDGVTGLIFRKDGLYQNLRGTETKLIQEDKGLVIPIPAPNFPNNTWAGLRLDNVDTNAIMQHRLWAGISDNTTVGQIEFYKRGAGTTALRFKPDGLYQKSGGVETKLATMADIANSGGGGGGGGSINFENCGTAALMRRWNNEYEMYETVSYSIPKILSAGKYLITCDLYFHWYMGQEEYIKGVVPVVVDLTGTVGNVDSFTARFIGSTDYRNEGGNIEYYLTETEFNVNYHSTTGTSIDISRHFWDDYSEQSMEVELTFIKIG